MTRSLRLDSPAPPSRTAAFLCGILAALLLWPSALLGYDITEKVKSHTLQNGLRLLVLERRMSPTVSIYLRYRAGAVDEVEGKTGMAHLLEHMMFKGTRTIGTRDYRAERKLLAQIERVGNALDRESAKGSAADAARQARLAAQLADLQKKQRRLVLSSEIDRLYSENGAVGLNASTGQDLTTYKVSVPANRIELWARIEAERMVQPVFREFYTERDVVMEERRQRSEADPDGKLLENYLAAAFAAHPYRRPILGWPSDMRYLDIPSMKEFFRRTHLPNNAVIAMVGDVDSAAALAIVERYFGSIPPRKIPSPRITEEPEQTGERRVEVIFDAEPKLIVGYHKPPPPDPADYQFDLIESILTRGRTSRLFKTLVQERGIAKSIAAVNGMPAARYPNQFVIFATPRHPHTAGDLERAIQQEIERLQTEPVSAAELEKVKNQIRADFIRGLDSNSGLASMLSYYEALLGDFRYVTGYTDAIEKITEEEIRQAARKYLRAENRTVATLVKKR